MEGSEELRHVAVDAAAGFDSSEFPVYDTEFRVVGFVCPFVQGRDEDRTGVEVAHGETGFVLVRGAVEVFVDSGVEGFCCGGVESAEGLETGEDGLDGC